MPIRDHKIHYQYHGRIQENTDLENLEKGDHVYLYGNRVGFGFKPTSELNGYNLVVIGKNDNNELLFKGFDSFDDKDCTYAEIIELFKSKLEEPLTYADLAEIDRMYLSKPDDYPYNCHLTHKEIYESLKSKYSERIDEEIYKGLSPNTDKKSASKIKVPPIYLSDSVIGFAFVKQFNPHAYYELTHRDPHKADSLLKEQTISKLVLPQETGFIPNFSQTETFQKELVGVVHDFYQECIDPQLEKKHLGLVVHGSPGTGKTHCCDFVIKKLETEHGKKIFRKGFHDEMLSKKDYVECLQIIDKHARIDKVIEKLSGQWKDINIFYVDDVNVDISEHNLVTQAILKYAKLHNKKVLINANSNYFDIIQKDYSKFTGFLRVINVIGQDYREQTAWHLGNQVDASSTISKEREWTPDQIKIFEWIQLLDKEDDPEKSNGLLITGKPGTGKTTVIKEALKEKKVQWVNNHTITSFLLQDLQSSNNEYLVIEDINDLRFNYQYKNLLAQICNSDQLKNKDGKPIKIILTSNGKNDLIENLKTDIFLENLGPRMNSRFAEKFKVVSVESTEDMRRPSHTYGAILDKVPGDIQKENILDLKEIFKKLTLLHDTEKYDEKAKYRKSIVDQVRLKEQIVINCNATLSDWRFLQKEFFQILDLMEDEGKQLFIIHDAPEVFKQELKELIRNDFLMPSSDQEKYLSRIGRLESMQSSDCPEVD